MSYAFRDWLIKFFGSGHNIPLIEELLKKTKALLEQSQHESLSNEQTERIFAELASVQEGLRDYLEEDAEEAIPAPVFSVESATAESALTYINNLQLWLASQVKDAFNLVWYSDPHLAFQTLVRETAKDDALIYLYYKYNASNVPVYLASSRFEQKNKAEYINEDAFGPLVGATLLKEGLSSKSQESDSEEEEEEEEEEHVHDEPIFYARVDLASGNLITWDDIKNTFPEDRRTFQEFVRDNVAAVSKDSETGKLFLNLEYLNITSPEELNSIPDIETVESLYLTHNNLGIIKPGAFSGFKNLEYITLDYNPSLTGEAFEGLEKLNMISIGDEGVSEEEKNNLRSTLPSEIFISFADDAPGDTTSTQAAVATDESTGEKYLYLADRNINSIEELNDIPDIDTVDSLYLTGNALGMIEPGAFSRFKNLRSIHLDYNPSLTGQAFEGLEKLKIVVITGENLSEIEKDAMYNSFPEGISVLFITPSE